ncbi:MAG: response regulator [Ginsengibacter sp.]
MEYINTILIADDSEMVVKVLSFMIKKAGYSVLSAANGKAALELLDGRNIDLVLTDLNMPVMNGIELIASIRASCRYRYTPVTLFVSDNEKSRKEIIQTSGATILFDKENIKDKIIPAIKKLLN